MKKLVILFTMVIFTSCVDKKQNEDSVKSKNNSSKNQVDKVPINDYCDELNKIDTKDTEEIQKWINKHEADLCNGNLYMCILDRHDIKQSIFNTMVVPNVVPFKIYWSEIRDKYIFDKCYDDYLSFDINNHKIISLKMVKSFTKKPSCFSPVLFRAIDKKNKLKDDDVFEFYIANDINGDECVVFKVKNNALIYGYYDLTLDPTLLPFSKK